MEPMERATTHRPAGHWPLDRAGDSLTLDFDRRHRRRIRLVTDSGRALLLDLPKTAVLHQDDGIQTEAGAWLRIDAAVEALLEARAQDAHHFARLAWHVGNRHVPAELGALSLRIRPDHVIAEMLVRLGAEVREIEAPFHPERGAYAQEGHHAHGDD
jgi:urease accessory protein